MPVKNPEPVPTPEQPTNHMPPLPIVRPRGVSPEVKDALAALAEQIKALKDSRDGKDGLPGPPGKDADLAPLLAAIAELQKQNSQTLDILAVQQKQLTVIMDRVTVLEARQSPATVTPKIFFNIVPK